MGLLLAISSGLCLLGCSTGVVEAQTSAPQLSGLSCNSTSIGGAGTDVCTVTISKPAPAGGFRVGLSSNKAAVTTPPAVMVAANATSAQFTATGSVVSTAQTVSLTATAGTVTKSFALVLNPPVPTLSIGVSSVAFGNVAVHKVATQTVTVKSTGTGPVTINGATVTGTGFTLPPSTFPLSINPGQTATLSAQFNPPAQGAATGKLTVSSNSSVNGTAAVALNGTGVPQLSGFSCASASIGGAGTDVCTVTISDPAPTGGFRVGLSSNNSAVTTPPAVMVAANATSAQFTATGSVVSAAQSVALTANDGIVAESFALVLNPPLPTLSIGVASVAFGNVAVNTPATKTVTLNSTGTGPVTISGAIVTGAGFTLTSGSFPLTVNAGKSATLTVQFDPSAEGAATGQLTVTSNSSTNGTAVVALNGTGIPQLSGLSCNSASISGAVTDVCIVTINQPAPTGGFRVVLSSNNAVVTVPAVVMVAPNASSAQFTATGSVVSAAQSVTLTASDGTVTKSFGLVLNPPVPTLSVSATSVAFGNVAVNTLATKTVTLTSTGTGPVTISGATVTGAGFTLTANSFPLTVNAGKSATLSVQFDPSAEGAATGQLTVTSNSSTNSTAVVALSGTGIPQLSGLSCGSASISGAGTDVCTVTINEPSPTGGFRVVLSSNNAVVTVPAVVMVAANASSAHFTATGSVVSTPQAVTVTASDGTVTETFALVQNAPVPTLSVSATSVSFGNVAVNALAAQSVNLNSTGTGPVTISGATVTGAGFTLISGTFPLTVNAGKSATLSVQFTPSAEGAATGQLTVTSNSSTNSTAVVALNGTGIPQLTGFSCSSASMTGTGTDVCTVTIGQPAPAGAFRVALSSSNAAVIAPPAVMVAANGTSGQFTLNVSGVPTAQTANLTANAGAATLNFALQLNAALPILSTSTPSLAFGNVALNVGATQVVTLTSTGAATVTISGATVAGTGFSITPTTFPVSLSPGQTFGLGVQFDPAAAQAATGQLTIASNSTVNPTAVVALSGTGATSGTFSYDGSPIASTLVPPNPTTPISANFFGMTIHHTATPFPAFPVSTFRFWDVAAWSTVESSSGVYDWSHVDTSISIGQTNGISDYIYTFGSVPAWASTDPTAPCTGGDGVGTCAPPNMAAFAEFATSLVQRYCGTIKYYETWNEANNSFYWSGNNTQLLAVAQSLYQIAKDPANCGCTNGKCSPNGGVNPNQVLTPSISGLSAPKLSWLDSYLSTAGTQYPYADVVAFHGYLPYGTTANAEQIVTEVQSLNQTLANHGLSNLPLWNTEASWGSIPSVDQDQASWIMRYHTALAVSGVSRFIWYAYDNCGWGTLWEAPWCAAPAEPTSQVTAPGAAYAVIQNWLSGATLANCQTYQNGLWICQLQRPGNYTAWMVWSSTGTDIPVPIPVSSGLTVYRDWQNNVTPLPSELTVGEMPVLLGNLNP